MEEKSFADRLGSKGCGGGGGVASRGVRKRRNEAEVAAVHEAPIKRTAGLDSADPNGVAGKGHVEGFDDLGDLGDFENDPFLSPKKGKGSPRKSVLGENFSGNLSWLEGKSEVSFDKAVRCRVEEARFVSGKWLEQAVLLREETSGAKGVCRLREVWRSLSLCRGDVVSVEARLCEGSWVVDNRSGFVVVQPDTLVSSTALVGSMFCMRQGVLRNFFKEMFSEESWKMVVGRLVHELFQEALKTGVRSEEELSKVIGKCLESGETLHDVFLCKKTAAEVEVEMRKFIPSVRHFLEMYVEKGVEPRGRNFRGSIESVLDIEELIKSPALGVQGRVDVTVRVRSEKGERVAPLELKTGRASFSSEHRFQLGLYVLLMKELGREVDSGLLLYLRDNVMEEVVPGRDEFRNLMLLRNNFVGYCKGIGRGNLPEPIRNVKWCAKCSYARVCSAYLRGVDGGGGVGESHPLRSLEMGDVSESHVDYFVRWNEMIWLEFEEREGEEGEGEVVEVEAIVEGVGGEGNGEERRYEFVRVGGSGGAGLGCGAFVQVVSGRGKRICGGRVVGVREGRVSVLADRRLTEVSESYKLVVLKSKFVGVYLSNLGWLLREEFGWLRELIIDKRIPGFDRNLDKRDFREKCVKNLLSLNKDQRKAVVKCLLCQEYLLVKGPPGTGKTQTIVTLIKILLALNKSVLVASHTNSAVDNILLKLDGVDYLRLGPGRSVHEEVRKKSYSALRESCRSVEEVKELFERKLIGATCMGIEANLVGRIRMDYCILDEGGQILQAEALRPLLCCRKFILVGDEDQLPPVVRNPRAKALGMCESLFGRLLNERTTVSLRLQYRMNSAINAVANGLTYEGLVECGSAEVAEATMKVRDVGGQGGGMEEWVGEVLSSELERSVVFVDTSECLRTGRGVGYRTEGRSSVLEGNVVVRLVEGLMGLGLGEDGVGVIAPFWDQVNVVRRKLSERGMGKVEVSTVDQFQGREKEVVLLSCTKERGSGREASEHELLSDGRRLTVAVTRAKHKLIILGDKETVVKYEPLRKLVGTLKESQFVRLRDGEGGFVREEFVKE